MKRPARSKLFGDDALAKLLPAFEAKFGPVKRKLVQKKASKPLELTAEALFERAWLANPLPGFDMVREHQFDPERRWRADFAWPAQKLAVELQGQGRHQRVMGERADHEKWRAYMLAGWRVLPWQSMLVKKEAADMIRVVHLALLGRDGPP